MSKPISESNEWTFDLIEQSYNEIEIIALDDFKLHDVYPNQIEIISAEQMIECYSSVAMPLMYDHWSYGKNFIKDMDGYKKGHMGLAYEVVINSSPCIAYLMETNTLTMQMLVLAHASFGHNYVFANNYLFKQWTDASAIIEYLSFAKKYIKMCEEKFGEAEVEQTLDACHALMSHGVDKYSKPKRLSAEEERKRQNERNDFIQKHINEIWSTIPTTEESVKEQLERKFPEDPQENILYFIEKNAPHLETWKREIIRIVRKIAQYFYPQKQTSVLNEGFASFTHYNIMNRMREKGLITNGQALEFLHNHSNVVAQPTYHNYPQFNVYALGFAMFQDIKRICLNPTEEDRQWFPDIAGCQNWVEVTQKAVKSFKDESFILQHLSPKVIRDFKMFSLINDSEDDQYEIGSIHNTEGYKNIRRTLARQYDLSFIEPQLQITGVDITGDRSLTVTHDVNPHTNMLLKGDSGEKVREHIQYLWGFDVYIEEVSNSQEILDFYH